jgi:aliphatic sulfonates family ABC transporter substrate-binding protein
MMVNRRTLLAAGLSAPLALSAAGRPWAADGKTLRVGFQKGEPLLMTAKATKALEAALGPKGVAVEWIEFQFGPPMLEAMRVGSIDVGAVGDAPPIFAQAAHGDLLYIAAEVGPPQGIILPAGSKIATLADLKGKKVAFGRGSSAHSFLLVALEKAGLRYDEIEPIYLSPADAGAAFERGAIDAWSIWEPYFALFANRAGVRTLVTNRELGEQYSFFLGNGPFVRANPGLTAAVVDNFNATGGYAVGHRDEVAAVLGAATGIPQDVWARAVASDPFTVQRVDERVVSSQQKTADRFRALGLIPVEIKVSDIVWRASV